MAPAAEVVPSDATRPRPQRQHFQTAQIACEFGFGEWVRSGHTVLITGPTGAGK